MTLLVVQVVAAGLRQKFAMVRKLLDLAPYVVVRDGELRLPSTPFGPQMSEEELFSRLREEGVFNLEGVRVVIIEPTGGVSVERAGERRGHPPTSSGKTRADGCPEPISAGGRRGGEMGQRASPG